MSRTQYRVYLAPQAVKDLEEIVEYISGNSPENARKLYSRLKQKASSLKTVPLRGRVVPELARAGRRDCRELIAKPYRIIYKIEERQVFVLAILDSRCDLEDLLLMRTLRKG